MKRQVIAVVIGSLFALPAFADGEIFGGYTPNLPLKPSLSREQVRAELVAAQRAGTVVIDGEVGSTARQAATTEHANKARAEVISELVAEYRAGNLAVDGETGQRL